MKILISELKCRDIAGKLNLLKPELRTLAKEIEILKKEGQRETNIFRKLNKILTTRTFLELKKIHEELKTKIKDKNTYKIDSEKARLFNLSVKKYRNLIEKAKNILSMFHTGHSMGCYRTFYLNNKTFTTNNLLHTYSKSCKYNPIYGNLSVSITKKQLIKTENIGGVLTIVGNTIETRKDYQIKEAEWLENTSKYKKGCIVEFVKGYLVEDYHATSIEQIYEKINQLVRIGKEEELMQEEIKILRSKFISLNEQVFMKEGGIEALLLGVATLFN